MTSTIAINKGEERINGWINVPTINKLEEERKTAKKYY